jgi:S-formylglutathione hydrolase FrmB
MKRHVWRLILLIALTVPAQSMAGDGQTLYKTLTVPNSEDIPYAVHLPDGFDPENIYPVLIGPGDGIKGEDAGFYWKTDPHSHGWIIVDAHLWESATKKNLPALLDAVAADFKVEGGKFHAVCWSANSAGIFKLVIDHADRFHSITGMAGNPSGVSKAEIQALQDVKVQFVVGEKDTYWQGSSRSAHEKLEAGGVDSVFEIVPNGEHVMTDLVGKGFMAKLEKLR